MQACMQPTQLGLRYSSSSRVSSSWQHCHALPRLPCVVTQHGRHRNIIHPRPAAASAASGSSQPGRSDDDIVSRQEVAQQGIRDFEQQLEQQQQSPVERGEELDATVAVLAATADPELDPDSGEASQQQQQQLQEWQQEWQQHLPWYTTSKKLYMAMAVGLTAAGALVSVCAGPIAAAGLKLGAGLPAVQAAVLVGCFGAAVLRAASLTWFLAEGAGLGELGSWRYQRINLGLAAAAAAAAVAAVTAGWAGAQPWLLLPLAGGCGATAAACSGMALGQARHGGFYFASALGYVDIFEGFALTGGYLLYNITSLAGAVMMGLAVLGLGLGLGALSSSAMLPLLPWLTPSSSGVAAATLMHKLLGCGLLLLALQAWALVEYAARARETSPEMNVKMIVVKSEEAYAEAMGQLGPAPVHAPAQRFDLLHVGFIAAAVAQGLWLLQAAAAAGPGLGLLNLADPLWGSLFWGVMGSVLYTFVLVARMDFSDIWQSFLRVMDWAGSVVAFGTGVMYADWMWLSKVDRR